MYSTKNEKDIYIHAPKLKDLPEEEAAILIKDLTKDYGRNRGIFHISFKVPYGKTFGYCGTNGAGKTTTLRHIMGFIKADSGVVKVKGLDAWKDAEEIKKYIGYLPGEIAFPSVNNGSDFLKSQATFINLQDMSKAESTINALQLDPTANLKRMSKGMKQKTALVAAFMHSPEIILLDEPTTGLDPLMRNTFIDLIKKERDRGATIIMSNHMFDELEETCDYVAFLKDGHLIDIIDMDIIHNYPYKEYEITFADKESFKKIAKSKLIRIIKKEENLNRLICEVKKTNTNKFISNLANVKIKLLKEVQLNLERFFMQNVIGGGMNHGE